MWQRVELWTQITCLQILAAPLLLNLSVAQCPL